MSVSTIHQPRHRMSILLALTVSVLAGCNNNTSAPRTLSPVSALTTATVALTTPNQAIRLKSGSNSFDISLPPGAFDTQLTQNGTSTVTAKSVAATGLTTAEQTALTGTLGGSSLLAAIQVDVTTGASTQGFHTKQTAADTTFSIANLSGTRCTPGPVDLVQVTAGAATKLSGIVTIDDTQPNQIITGSSAALTFRTAHFILAFGCPKVAASASPSASASVAPTASPTPSPTASPAAVVFTQVTTVAGKNGEFTALADVTVDASGNMYTSDINGNRIFKVSPQGAVTPYAGNGTAGFAEGTGTTAQFSSPSGLVVDSQGNLFVSDRANNRIRKIDASGVVTTFAGGAGTGTADGTGTNAQFNLPNGLRFDKNGNLFLADSGNQRIRMITPAGVVTTLAGSTAGFADGTGSAAQFYVPAGLAVDQNTGDIYVADHINNRIRKVTAAGVVTTYAGDGTSQAVNGPGSVSVDTAGNVYFGLGLQIFKIDTTRAISTFAGDGTNGTADGSLSTASFRSTGGLQIGPDGNMYVADRTLVRKITR